MIFKLYIVSYLLAQFFADGGFNLRGNKAI